MTCQDLAHERLSREHPTRKPANKQPSTAAMTLGLIAWFLAASAVAALLSIHLQFAGTEQWLGDHRGLTIISGAASTD